MRITDLKEQKEFLEKYLNDINIIVSAKLGIRTNFKITERKTYNNALYYCLEDKRNFVTECGIMSTALKELTMYATIYWNENNTTMSFHFDYELNRGGSNGCEFCLIGIDYDKKIVRLWR